MIDIEKINEYDVKIMQGHLRLNISLQIWCFFAFKLSKVVVYF